MTRELEHVAWVRELVSQEAALAGDKPAVTGLLQRLCRAAVRELPASGVGISLMSHGSGPLTVAASSPASVLVEELQFAMAEGPCIDAVASGSPVLVPDLNAAGATTWPGYTSVARDHGVRAVFAIPLHIDSSRFGALDVYRDQPGSLPAPTLSLASAFAEVTERELLAAGQRGEDAVDLIDAAFGDPFAVYQAQGMVMIQLGVSLEESLARLRAHAYTHDERLSEVAGAVLERRLDMSLGKRRAAEEELEWR